MSQPKNKYFRSCALAEVLIEKSIYTVKSEISQEYLPVAMRSPAQPIQQYEYAQVHYCRVKLSGMAGRGKGMGLFALEELACPWQRASVPIAAAIQETADTANGISDGECRGANIRKFQEV